MGKRKDEKVKAEAAGLVQMYQAGFVDGCNKAKGTKRTLGKRMKQDAWREFKKRFENEREEID